MKPHACFIVAISTHDFFCVHYSHFFVDLIPCLRFSVQRVHSYFLFLFSDLLVLFVSVQLSHLYVQRAQ